CADNLRYFADTFGKENIVAAHLHMDEKTPHMHVTLVPIVKGERKRRKREEQAKKRYRKKPADSVRLCADDIMSRLKLKSYQDSYAAAMAKYGLQRGIDGSEARHVSTQQYYRDIKRQTKELKAEVVELQEQKDTAREELTRTKKEIQTERLKGAATTAAANIAESVGSLFGNNKVKTLERENTVLHREVADHEETIEALQTRIQTLQADHSRQLLDMQQKHINELAQTETNLKREISRLTVLLNKTLKWFPQIKDMINIERLCLAVGFNKEQTATLLTGRPIEYNGELYSEEHKRKFMAKDVKAKVFSDNGRFILTIDLRPIGEWFKEQFERLRQTIRQPVIPQRKDRGMKL
ncbi:mobilization protein, partial [Bacteroides ovatus]